MQVRNIILAVASVLILGALVLLLFKIGDSPRAHVPEDQLAKARQRHERTSRVRPAPDRAGSATPRVSPAARPAPLRTPSPQASNDSDDAAEPEGNPRIRRRLPSALNAKMRLSPGLTGSGGGDADGLRERMNEANSYYDRADYETALERARDVLKDSPRNVRMLRIVVSASCIMGDEQAARESYELLPRRDQAQMARRCARYGVEF